MSVGSCARGDQMRESGRLPMLSGFGIQQCDLFAVSNFSDPAGDFKWICFLDVAYRSRPHSDA